MVWILTSPNGFGDYWPYGDFEGWDESLFQRFAAMPEAFRGKFDNDRSAYVKWVSDKFTKETGTRVGSDPVLTPLEPEEVPHVFKTEKRYDSLASLIRLNNGLIAVDDDLKTIIERLEPGVHQFYPLQIVMTKGRVYPKPYFLLVVGRFLNSFSPEQSVEGSWRVEENIEHIFWQRSDSKDCYAGLAFDRSIIGDAHLWRDHRFVYMEPLMSDRLQSEIVASRLRIPKHWKAREV